MAVVLRLLAVWFAISLIFIAGFIYGAHVADQGTRPMTALKRIGWGVLIVLVGAPVTAFMFGVWTATAGIGVLIGTHTAEWKDGFVRVRKVHD